MIVLHCDINGCKNSNLESKVYGMSQKFKDRFIFQKLDHICKGCLDSLSKRIKEYRIDNGVLHLINEDVYEKLDYQAVDR